MSHRPINKLESLFANFLKNLNIEFTFQYFINDGENCKSYDFKLINYNLIFEIDGDFWHGNPNSKNKFYKWEDTQFNDRLKEEIASKRGLKVIRFWESEIKKDPEKVIEKIKGLIKENVWIQKA